MSRFQPRDPEYTKRVADAFRNEFAASRWGGELTSVSPGVVEITLPAGEEHCSSVVGLIHRSFVAAILDGRLRSGQLSASAPLETPSEIVEYKINFLAHASPESVVARAEVLRPGRTITVCTADAFADGRPLAKMLATLVLSRPA